MTNDKYWANRMRVLEESLLDTGYDYVENLERQYDLAIREVEAQMSTWYQRFAKNNEITLAEARRLLSTQELTEFRWTVEEYIKYGQENAISQAWMKQLENASARVHISRLDSLKLQLQQQAEALYGNQLDGLDSLLTKTYSEGYYRTAFEIQHGLGVGWSLHGISDAEIKKVLSKPWTLDGQTFSDRIWANKQSLINSVNTQLTQMIMRGQAPDKAIKVISERFKVSKSQAGRLVMTESAAFANEARKDCFNDLDVEQYVIVETLDKETCPLCGQLDGKVYKMSEYTVGVTAPPFHPWCRGTTAPYFADMEGVGDRFARADDGSTYEVPRDMTYKDWYDKSVNEKIVEMKTYEPEYPSGSQVAKSSSKIKDYGVTNTGDSTGNDSLAKYTQEDGTLSPEREELHREIIDKFFEGVEPADGQPIFTIMGGGPAAGKSTMINSGAASLPQNSVMVDSDAIKAMFPEYKEMVAAGDGLAASYVHEESSALAKRILGIANNEGYNVVLDGTGDGSVNSLTKKISDARNAGMAVEGIYATVPTEVAVERATARAAKTGRVVNAEAVIIPTHRKVSQILPECAHLFDSVKLYDTTEGAILIATGGNGQGLTAISGQEELFEAFLQKGK